MGYKRYIRKNGKVYGPYEYESRKKGGKVSTKYLGKSPKKRLGFDGKSFHVLVIVLVLLLISQIILIDILLTGRVTLSINSEYSPGEEIYGSVKLNMKHGELIPMSTNLVVDNAGERTEYSLDDLISSNSVEGDFYIENSEISGSGSGIGFAGEKTIYPEVNFVFRIIDAEDSVGNAQEINEVNKTPEVRMNESSEAQNENASENSGVNRNESSEEGSEVVNETTETEESLDETSENTEEIIEETASNEESDSTKKQKTKESPTKKQRTEESSTETDSTKKQKTKESSTKKQKTKEKSGKAKITGGVVNESKISGSVSYNNPFTYEIPEGKTIEIVSSEQDVDWSISNGVLEITTDYSEIKEGFGEDYVLDSEEEVEIDLSQLNLTAREGELIVSFVYNNSEIVSTNKNINVVNRSLNETESNLTLNITNVTEINETSENETLNVSKDVTASINTTQYGAVVGMPVKWKKKIQTNKPSNITVEVPKEAKNITVYRIERNKTGNVSDENASGITGKVSLDIKLKERSTIFSFFGDMWGKITGKSVDVANKPDKKEVVIDENASEYEVEYETPASESIEKNLSNGKEVTISSEFNYKNILAYTELPKEVSKDDIRIYHKLNGSRVPVEFTAYDSQGNVVKGNEVKIVLYDENSSDKQIIYDERKNGSLVNFSVKDLINKSYEIVENPEMVGFVTWVVPHLSSQTYEVIIEITSAEHLDSNKSFIKDIYPEVSSQDDVWYNVSDSEYVRVRFKGNLSSENDITLYANNLSENSSVEVYSGECSGNVTINGVEVPLEIYAKKQRIDEIQGVLNG